MEAVAKAAKGSYSLGQVCGGPLGKAQSRSLKDKCFKDMEMEMRVLERESSTCKVTDTESTWRI